MPFIFTCVRRKFGGIQSCLRAFVRAEPLATCAFSSVDWTNSVQARDFSSGKCCQRSIRSAVSVLIDFGRHFGKITTRYSFTDFYFPRQRDRGRPFQGEFRT